MNLSNELEKIAEQVENSKEVNDIKKSNKK